MDRPPISHNLVFTTCLLNEGIYLTGVVAGNMIPQGGLVCLIKGFDVSSVQQGINAFALGLFKYNPTARFKTTTINSWTDYYQEAQAAERFYAMGCDLISHQTSHAKTMGVFTTKKKFGYTYCSSYACRSMLFNIICSVGVYSESRSLLGEYVLTSGVFNWTPGHTELLQYALDGTLHNRSLVKGYLDGAEYASPLSGMVPYNVRLIYEQEQAELKQVFCARDKPVLDNTNSSVPRILPGQCLSNQNLYDMLWTVQGIESLGTFQPTPPAFSDAHIPQSLKFAYIVVVVIFYVIAICLGYFMSANKDHAVFKFAQPFFLYIVLLGCCIGISAVIPLTIDVSISDEEAFAVRDALAQKSYPLVDRGTTTLQYISALLSTHLCTVRT
jgi:hypothetical protein